MPHSTTTVLSAQRAQTFARDAQARETHWAQEDRGERVQAQVQKRLRAQVQAQVQVRVRVRVRVQMSAPFGST